MYARILVPTDGSACSDEAIAQAVAIAKAMGSTLLFLFAMDTFSSYHEGLVSTAEALDALTVQGEAILERAEKSAADAGVRATTELVEGSPAEVITSRAADFDLVVMGSHGKGLLQRLTVGSVTEAVLHRIACPLLVVRCHMAPVSR